jgi:hypothetical protein
MIELAATFTVTGTSVLLFAYWFRYVCVLILSARTARNYAAEAASANQLNFLAIQSVLRDAVPEDLERLPLDLDRLKYSLDRDYRVLTYLLTHSAKPSTGDDAVEKRVLEIDYRLMSAWYLMARHFSPAAACRALEEMSKVVAHFANTMGERAAAAA